MTLSIEGASLRRRIRAMPAANSKCLFLLYDWHDSSRTGKGGIRRAIRETFQEGNSQEYAYRREVKKNLLSVCVISIGKGKSEKRKQEDDTNMYVRQNNYYISSKTKEAKASALGREGSTNNGRSNYQGQGDEEHEVIFIKYLTLELRVLLTR